jgi:hypothetical protein
MKRNGIWIRNMDGLIRYKECAEARGPQDKDLSTARDQIRWHLPQVQGMVNKFV